MPDMASDWDERARKNARYFIATSVPDTEEAFVASGRSDVENFFGGLEDLLGPEVTVLDIGCGIGRMDEHIAPRVGRLIGIDVSAEMIERARKRLEKIANVEFVVGDGWTLGSIPDASIDLVFSHIVFQHMPRKATWSYLKDAFRVLRPQGHLVFQMPEAAPDGPDDPPEQDTFEMRFYSEEDLRSRLEQIGFDWLDSARFPVAPLFSFNQLRVHVAKG